MSIFDIFEKLRKAEQPLSPIEYIIAGLGNPGSRYERTRHNAGFMAVDILADELGVKVNKLKFKALTGECRLGQKRCLLLKPSDFMNLSGQSVTAAMQFYKIPIEKVIVLFDDISLPSGKLRIRRKGSDGGHNGLKNIIYLSGKDDFPRVKIGVGAKPRPDYDLADWVLSAMTQEDLKLFTESMENLREILTLIVEDNIDEAMSRFN